MEVLLSYLKQCILGNMKSLVIIIIAFEAIAIITPRRNWYQLIGVETGRLLGDQRHRWDPGASNASEAAHRTPPVGTEINHTLW